VPGSIGSLCAAKGSGLCLQHVGTSIFTEVKNTGLTQQMADKGACGGVPEVTTTPACPFNNDSGLNATYKNDPIIFIILGNTCVGANDASDAAPRNCPVEGNNGGTGIVWVEAGTNALINVYDSNQDNSAQYLCSQGASGDFVITKAFVNGPCQWSFVN
jgi:hypothetical protein